MKTGKRLLAAAALACGACTAHASSPSLEEAFWVCDYIATTRGTAAAPSACVGIYEEFKATKFDGNFEALVGWWQANKSDAHARMAGMVAAMPSAPVASAPDEVVPAKPSRTARVMAATRTYFAELVAALRND